MVSAWWLLAAFVAGGFAGVLLVALMFMSGRVSEQAERVPNLKIPPPWPE
jgi:hypothetical protein